jgi:hypothetical protein
MRDVPLKPWKWPGGGRTLRAGAGRFLQLLVVEQPSPDVRVPDHGHP